MDNLKKRADQVDLLKNNAINKLQRIKKFNKNIQHKIQLYRNQGSYKQIFIRLNQEIDKLKNKQKQMIAYETKRKQKKLKQQEYIRRLQVQLLQNGVSRQSVQDMMNKIVYGHNTNKATQPIKYTRQQNKIKIQEQYNKITSQIIILKKSIKQQQKLLEDCINMQKQAAEKQRNTRTIQKQLDEAINKLQQSIKQARKMINPANLKPKPLPPKDPSLQDQKQFYKQHLKEVRKKFYEKKTKRYLQSLQNIDKQVNQFTNNEDNKQRKSRQAQLSMELKTEEVIENLRSSQLLQPDEQIFGKIDKNGIIFSDKQISLQLGQQQCKITSLTIINQQNKIVGIQAKYNYKTSGKLHQYISIQSHRQNDKNFINERISEEFQCVQQQFITAITGTFSSKSILANLTVLTNMNRYHKFGCIIPENNDKEEQFQICNDSNGIPSYILGCVNRIGICQFGTKIIKSQD